MSWLFLIALGRSLGSFVEEFISLSARKAFNARWESSNKSTSASELMNALVTHDI